MERADMLSKKAGTLCKKAGSKQHYHDSSGQEGRGMRISRYLPHADLPADSTDTEVQSEHESSED